MLCELCESTGGELLWRNDRCRVVRVADADYPGFCRVVWNAHIKEMSDLTASERHALMNIVFAVEQAIRSTLAPDKVNLACLGNVTPHLHWHVIPRFADDMHFPSPIWSEPRRHRDDSRAASRGSTDHLQAAVTREIFELDRND